MAESDPTDIPPGLSSARVDALYGLALDDFTSSRDALAKELRQAGERQGAEWVKGLRKPTAAAWAVNQLARTQTKEAKRLLEAGEELGAAHERVLTGEATADDLRRTADVETRAVRALLERATGLLDRDGRPPSPDTLEKAGQTLHALALDEETRTAFRVGRVTRDRRATGLGPFGESVPTSLPAPQRRPKKEPRNARQAKDRAAKKRAEAEAALKAADAELGKRQRAVATVERELASAREEVERAQRRLERTTSELEEARAAEAEAQAAVTAAQAELEHALESAESASEG